MIRHVGHLPVILLVVRDANRCLGTGPHCTFSESPANPGECTREGGYLANAEINDVYKGKSVLNPRAEGVNYWFDLVSHSDMMTWGDQWVAWMSDDTKSKRTGLYKS